MKLPLHPAAILCLWLVSLTSPLQAAEVTNLKTDFTAAQLTIEYDLPGKTGEKDSGVEVLMVINGSRYTSPMLSLSGDFGSRIPVGRKRRITWSHRQDFPEGLDKTFRCIVNAVPNGDVVNEGAAPSEGVRSSYYAVNKQTIVETRSRLMWSRNANLAIKPMKHTDAVKNIAKLNRERHAGYSDWRIPTQQEFERLLLSGKQDGWGTGFSHFIADYLGNCGFRNVQPGNYWTATKPETDQNKYFVANTWNGNIRTLEDTNYYYLWPVRTAR
jgi:hypothetical protein